MHVYQSLKAFHEKQEQKWNEKQQQTYSRTNTMTNTVQTERKRETINKQTSKIQWL